MTAIDTATPTQITGVRLVATPNTIETENVPLLICGRSGVEPSTNQGLS